MRLPNLTALAVLAAAIGAGCSSGPTQATPMGEPVQVGPLVYTVLEAEWHNELGAGTSSRVPKSKFLILRVQIANSGNKEASVPLLPVKGSDGNEFLELSDGTGVSDWMGPLRNINPTETLSGRLIYDIPAGEYNLVVTDAGDLDKERTALINIPLKIGEGETPVQKLPGQ